MEQYTTIVGMEIHVELSTKSKMFCGCKNDPFHAPKPNIYTCPVCLGFPGGIPVPNKTAIEWTVMLGLALGSRITRLSKFDRKNYFYPDLAKGYQISQYDAPFCVGGEVPTDLGPVRINRVHLEEDTGKLMHTTVDGRKVTLVDFNRSGVPLVEIVTEPDIRSSEQARQFVKKLHQIVRWIGISHADLEKGSMRLEPNISVKKGPVPVGSALTRQDLPKYKVEVKNINSFSFVKKAIDFETARHIRIIEAGNLPVQETRGFVESKGETVSQRIKEDAADYRYFPEPDIPPVELSDAFIDERAAELPELPDAKANRFVTAFGITPYDAGVLTETRERAEFFEAACAILTTDDAYVSLSSKAVANVIINKKPDITKVTPKEVVADIVRAAADNAVDESVVAAAVAKALETNPKAVAEYKGGKTGVFMFLIGQVKKELKGKGDAAVIEKLLKGSLT